MTGCGTARHYTASSVSDERKSPFRKRLNDRVCLVFVAFVPSGQGLGAWLQMGCAEQSLSRSIKESHEEKHSQMRDLSFTRKEQLISFVLKLLKRDLSAGVGLQMCVELIVLLQTGFEGRVCQNSGTEFLKMHTYPVERKAASTVGTFNYSQRSPECLLSGCYELAHLFN